MRHTGVWAVAVLVGAGSAGDAARAQEAVYNAYVEAARKAQDEQEKGKLYRLALEEAERLDNPKLLGQALVATGMFEEGRGNYPEAERLLKRGLERAEAPLFAAHVNALMGNLYRGSGRPAEALPYYRKAVALREANQPPGAFELAEALRDLADCQRELGQLTAAAPLYAKSIAIVEKQPRHRYHLAFALSGLAELRLAEKNPVAAEALARQALGIYAGLNPRHPFNEGLAHTTLGKVQEQAGKAEAALALYRTAIGEFDQPRPSTQIRTLPALEGAARLLRKAGRADEAGALEQRAADIRALRTVKAAATR